RAKIINYCQSSPQVAYFAELTGIYQYSVSLFCRTVFEVQSFFQKLGKMLPGSAFETSFALRLEFTQFTGRTHEKPDNPVVLSRKKVKSESSIDNLDRKILDFYSRNADRPLRDVARHAGCSESTVRNRLAALEKAEIIHSYPYLVDNTKIGITT